MLFRSLSRNLDFRALSIRSNIAVIISGVIGIGMALAGFRVWALVAQQIVRDSVALILLWKLSPWRPRFTFSWTHLKDLVGFSISNFTAQLGLFAEGQTASIFLGLFFGPVAVGLYRVADRLVNSVVVMATTSIQAVSLPEFARNQANPVELRKSALTSIRLSSAMTLPALSGMAAVSWALMATLGPQWTSATGALKVLCVMGMSTVFACFTGPMLQAISKPHYVAILAWGRTAIGTILLVVVGLAVRNRPVTWQITGIAVARTVALAGFVMPVFLYILMRICNISFRDLRIAVAPSVFASAGTIAAVELFHLSGLLANGKPVILLAAEVFVGGVVGVVVLLAADTQLRGFVVALQQRISRSPAFSRSG